ncbi:MerR family transcriptional regulator [Streptomyces sp. NPDC001948]
MRIGELAALVGITPRAVRHYHHLGLLPEPARRSSGYRAYGVREAVPLARPRRLTELGLGLDEVRDVLADDAGREVVEVLEEVDEDLGRQEAVVQERRAQLASLPPQARAGQLSAEGPLSPELTRLLAGPGELPDSPMAVKDREHLAFLDAALPEEKWIRPITALHGIRECAEEAYGLLEALAGVHAQAPQVIRAAAALAALLPDETAAHVADDRPGGIADTILRAPGPGPGGGRQRRTRIHETTTGGHGMTTSKPRRPGPHSPPRHGEFS